MIPETSQIILLAVIGITCITLSCWMWHLEETHKREHNGFNDFRRGADHSPANHGPVPGKISAKSEKESTS